jgi:hypothetical protein
MDIPNISSAVNWLDNSLVYLLFTSVFLISNWNVFYFCFLPQAIYGRQ